MSTPVRERAGAARALRWVAAIGTAISAIVHGYLYLNGFSQVAVTGPMFAVNAVAGLVIAVALTASAHWVWAFLAAGFNAVSIVALLISHTEAGFFGTREMFWDTWQLMAVGAEGVALVAACWLLVRALRTRGRR